MKTGIHIHTAVRIEDLADALFEELARPADLFEAPLVVVPNRNVRRFLSLRRASGPLGVSAHIRFLHLEKALRFLLEEMSPSAEPIRIIDRKESILRVYAALARSSGSTIFESMTSPLRPGAAVRRYHLADRLSRIFQEYEYHRASLVNDWWKAGPENFSDLPDSIREILSAERRIFLEAFKDIRSLRFPRYAESALSKPEPRKTLRMRIFGFSQMSRFHLDLIARIADIIRVDFYFLDLLSGSESDRVIADWCRPFREAVDVLTAHGARLHKIPNRSSPRGGKSTVLAELERACAGGSPKKIKQDTSVQIISCPTGRREIEMIHDSIMTNLAADPTLLLTDIALLVPDMKSYRPWIESIFLSRTDETGRPRIPFNLTDFSAYQESQYVNALESLLGLVGKDATRLELFQLFRNPCFQAAWNVSADDVENWSRWVDDLGAHRFFDRAHQEGAGVEGDNLFTWDQALRRMRLGRVMERGKVFQSLDPYQDMDSGHGDLLSKFSLVIFELGNAVRSLAQPRPARGMCVLLRSFLDTFIGVPKDRAEESSVEDSIREGLEWLGREGESVGLELGADLALQFLLSMASDIPANRGRYLAGGVTIAALQPMRPVPFRIIYLAGMNEEFFPGKKERSVLNLRSVQPVPDDFTAPDLNRMLFLETVRSAREKIVISYVGRDLVKDRDRAPASPVLELRELLQRLVLDGESFRPVSLPLAGDGAWLLEAGSALDSVSDIRQTWDPVLRELTLRRFRGETVSKDNSSAPVLNPDPPAADTHTIKIQDLASFLENPVEGALARLGLREEEIEDSAEEEDEPFYLPFFTRRQMLVDTVTAFLQRADRATLPEQDAEIWIRSVVESAMEEKRRASLAPRSAFGKAAEASLQKEIATSALRLRSECIAWKTRWALFSRPSSGAVTIPAQVELGARTLEFISRPFFFYDSTDAWGILDLHLSKSLGRRRCAAHFLMYVVLRALPEEIFPGSDRPFQLVCESPNAKVIEKVTWQLTRAEAVSYLKEVTDAFLAGNHEFLPWDLWENQYSPDKEDLNRESYVEDLELALLDRVSAPFPVVRVRSAELAGQNVPKNAWDLVMNRWKPIYAGFEKAKSKNGSSKDSSAKKKDGTKKKGSGSGNLSSIRGGRA